MQKIELLEMVIAEPVSALSDVLTGAVSLYVAGKLLVYKDINKDTRHFVNYFVLMGLSTILAGILGHAMQHYITKDWKLIGWILSAMALFFFQFASITYYKEKLQKAAYLTLLFIILLQIILFHIFILYPDTRSFKVVQLNLTLGYVGFIVPLYFYAFLVWKEEIAFRIFLAIALAGLAALAYNYEISLHEWCDHNVVSHLIIAAFIVVLYSGVLRLLDVRQGLLIPREPK